MVGGEQEMSSQETPGTALALSLAGGVLMLVSGILPLIVTLSGGYGYGYGYYGGMMGGWGGPFGFVGSLWFIGLIAGIIVIICAIMLGSTRRTHKVGNIDTSLLNSQFLWMHGRILHRRSTRHSRRRPRPKLETITKSLET